MAKKHSAKKNTLDNQVKQRTREGDSQVIYLEHCIVWLRDLHTKKMGSEILRGIQNVNWRIIEKIEWLENIIRFLDKLNRNDNY